MSEWKLRSAPQTKLIPVWNLLPSSAIILILIGISYRKFQSLNDKTINGTQLYIYHSNMLELNGHEGKVQGSTHDIHNLDTIQYQKLNLMLQVWSFHNATLSKIPRK